jgi:hypothetical protein
MVHDMVEVEPLWLDDKLNSTQTGRAVVVELGTRHLSSICDSPIYLQQSRLVLMVMSFKFAR